MNKNFKYLQKLFFLLVMGFSLCALQACSGDDDDDDNVMDDPTEEPVDNTSAIAVTGAVNEYACSYAYISGYANLNLLPAGSGNPEIGVELYQFDEDEEESWPDTREVTSLTGNSFVVEFDYLRPATKYKYRTFVEYSGLMHYGEFRTFTTKDVVPNLTSTGEAKDITFHSATITAKLNKDALEKTNEFDLKKYWLFGVAYSTSKSALHPDSTLIFEREYYDGDIDGEYTLELSNLSSGCTYYYASFVSVPYNSTEGFYFSEIKSFKTPELVLAQTSGAVDLGLSVKWAACNVGASSPEDYGGYYAWGETEEKSDYSWNTYKYYKGNTGYVDIGSNISGTQYDVAHVKWGGSWRMPTNDEITELCSKCSWVWTTYNGVYGRLVTGPNGNSIFLPAAGERYGTDLNGRGSYGNYWSATLYEGSSYYAYGLYFYFGSSYWGDYWLRYFGYTVRPVTE